MGNKHTFAHNDWDAGLVFPFVVTKFNQAVTYLDPIWGIRIHRLFADGSPVHALRHDADLDEADFRKIPLGEDPFIYQVRRSNLVFARAFNEQGEYRLERFDIPLPAKLIVIEYRLRESNESQGPVLILESRMV